MSINTKNTFFILLCCVFISKSQGQIKEYDIAKGWSKNSVNAVVFRKNSLVTHKNIQFTAFYDTSGYLVLAKRKVGKTNWTINKTNYTGNVKDAHNNISITVDGTGYLHVSWDHHNNPLNYACSTVPYGLDLSEKRPMTGTEEERVTYPEFYCLPNGNLLFMYRNGASGKGNLVINSYDVKTKKWKRIYNSLIDGENKRNAYWQACVDETGTVHISWVWRESADVASNHDMCYARSADGGENWVNSHGEAYKIPITEATAEVICKIPQNSELINQTSMTTDDNGNPYIASYWKTSEDNAPQYRLIYKKNGEWTSCPISKRTQNFTLSGIGTKKIPVSRPQIIVNKKQKATNVYCFFRDEERDSKVSVSFCNNLDKEEWQIKDLTNYSVGSWEPSFDTELWKDKKQINLFIQKVGQGDGEQLDAIPAQMVKVLEWIPEK